MKLCDKIAKLRKRKGLSQEELANELDVSRQSVFKWEAGENTPDIGKIKKLAKLFNVSFDVLLDDEVDLDEDSDVTKKSETKKSKKPVPYRETYDSGVLIKTSKQADYEHGYGNSKKKIPGYSIEASAARHKELISKKEYSKVIRVQYDLLVDFFIDETTKTFGFFFDGAPQFVCPFENFAGFYVTNDGVSTSISTTPMVGVGIGRNPSFMVGSVPVSRTRSPLRYDCSISYFDKDGSLETYQITFLCNRMYIVYDGTVKSPEELDLWQDVLSKNTNKNLNEIASCLKGVGEIGAQIKNGDISVKPFEMAPIAREVKAGQELKTNTYVSYRSSIARYKYRKKKYWIIALIAAAAIAVVSISGWAIGSAVERHQIEETNRNNAQKVIDLIDAIGEVTLSSGHAIIWAENSYSQLTPEQKALVTNYYTLVQARSQYEKLQNDKREEDTKDDPTRTIVLSDLNGTWKSDRYQWKIMDFGEKKSVLYWVSGGYNLGIISSVYGSSSLKGYNNQTRRMEISLYYYNPSDYLDVTMTKSLEGELTLYSGNQMFQKTESW